MRFNNFCKRLLSGTPEFLQLEIKRMRLHWHIRHGRFTTPEPEFEKLSDYISPGDWVIDVGANVGHYTLRFSELVGCEGRVIAIEPIPHTFSLLAANATLASNPNITLLNLAASDITDLCPMAIPLWENGMKNYYQAALTQERSSDANLPVMKVTVDSLHIPAPVILVKIDAEGHELEVLTGMRQLIQRDLPRLIVEGNAAKVRRFLHGFGYEPEYLSGSPNVVYTCHRTAQPDTLPSCASEELGKRLHTVRGRQTIHHASGPDL